MRGEGFNGYFTTNKKIKKNIYIYLDFFLQKIAFFYFINFSKNICYSSMDMMLNCYQLRMNIRRINKARK